MQFKFKVLQQNGVLPFASYHNHSTWSDGCAEMEQMVLAARDMGMVEYGMSDHYVVRPDGFIEDWSMRLEALDAYVETCEALKRKYSTPSFRLWSSLETEFFPENAEAVVARLRNYPFDYLIGAVHFSGYFSVDNNIEDWLEACPTQPDRDCVFHGYWQRELELCKSGLFDMIAHLDLPKKFGFAPSYDATDEIEAVLSALAASGKVMEVNTAGWDKPCNDSYPSANIIRRAKELAIPMVLASDSHDISHIGRHYDLGAAALGATIVPSPARTGDKP